MTRPTDEEIARALVAEAEHRFGGPCCDVGIAITLRDMAFALRGPAPDWKQVPVGDPEYAGNAPVCAVDHAELDVRADLFPVRCHRGREAREGGRDDERD